MTDNSVDICYVVSPDYETFLFYAMGSLLNSGTTFDSIRVSCVGEKPERWDFFDPRIATREVKPLIDGSFLINKIYALESDADIVVMLDSDALVLRPLNRIWEDTDADVIARTASRYHKAGWDRKAWQDALHSVGAGQEAPYFNSGLVVFRNQSHKKIKDVWHQLTLSGMKKEAFDPGKIHHSRNVGQIALSLSVAKLGLSYKLMSENEHFFDWNRRSGPVDFTKITFYHTGSARFPKRVHQLIDLKLISPSICKVTKT